MNNRGDDFLLITCRQGGLLPAEEFYLFIMFISFCLNIGKIKPLESHFLYIKNGISNREL